MMKCSRRCVTFVLVSLLVCSCVWAFPKAAKSIEETKVEVTPVVVVTAPAEAPKAVQVVTSALSEPTEKKSDETLTKLSTKLEDYNEARKVDKKEVIALLEEVKEDFEVLKKDAESKEAQIVDLQNLYHKEKLGCKFFATVNGSLGLEEADKISYGAGATVGMRWGKGFLTQVGVNYKIGVIGEPIELKFDKKNCTLTLGVGWEW